MKDVIRVLAKEVRRNRVLVNLNPSFGLACAELMTLRRILAMLIKEVMKC